MKIRWTANSIRLRITPDELNMLQQKNVVREALPLGSGSWAMVICPAQDETTLTFEAGDLRILLTQEDVHRLAAPAAEGIYFQQAQEPYLRYYIEKDFPCEHPRPAEAPASSGTFDRPTETLPIEQPGS